MINGTSIFEIEFKNEKKKSMISPLLQNCIDSFIYFIYRKEIKKRRSFLLKNFQENAIDSFSSSSLCFDTNKRYKVLINSKIKKEKQFFSSQLLNVKILKN